MVLNMVVYFICSFCGGLYFPKNIYQTGIEKYPSICKHCLKIIQKDKSFKL